MSVTMQWRRDTAANWTTANPVLAAGEPGYETDTKKMKVGDGTTAWASLPYWVGGAAWTGGTASGYFAPAVVNVTDNGTITVNAQAGNVFRVTLTTAVGATRAVAAPSNPVDGQELAFEFIQPATGGPCAVTWSTTTGGFTFGAVGAPSLSTTAGASDLVAFRYSGAKAMWELSSAAAVTAETARAEAAEASKVSRSGDTMTGGLSPRVVTLTDAATIAVVASLANDFRVTLGGNRTMGAPSSPADGQVITFEIIQDSTGTRTLTWTSGAGGYSFGSGAAPVLSTAAGATDLAAFRYSAAKAQWLALGSSLGY